MLPKPPRFWVTGGGRGPTGVPSAAGGPHHPDGGDTGVPNGVSHVHGVDSSDWVETQDVGSVHGAP